MTNEEFYDAEIAPALKEICAKCQAREMSFVASVEYDPPNAGRGRTEFQMPTQPILLVSASQLLSHWSARCSGNVDSLIIAIMRHAEKHGHSSAYLRMLGSENVKYSGNEVAAITVTHP